MDDTGLVFWHAISWLFLFVMDHPYALQYACDRVVVIVCNPFFEGNYRVIGYMDMFWANFGATFGDIAHSYSGLSVKLLPTVEVVHGVHFERSDTHHLTWAKKNIFTFVLAENVANILAEKAFNAFAELLDAIHVLLQHIKRLTCHLGLRLQGGYF